MTPASSTSPIRVWDLPTRLFHWALALLIVFMLISASVGGLWMEWHILAGQAVLALLLFRVVWGLIGGHWSRFSSFFHGPGRLLAYLRGQPHAHDDIGHSPTAALSVYTLLLVLSAQGVIGLFSYDDIAFGGPLAAQVSSELSSTLTSWHRQLQPVVIALALLHVSAVLYYVTIKRRQLVGAMLHGDKEAPSGTPISRDDWRSRLLALLLLLACSALMFWISSLGGDISAGYL